MINKQEPIKIGVVGVGHLGQHHARIYHELKDCVLTGIADVDIEQAEKIASLYRTKAFTNFRDLFPYVDSVSIAVPTSQHYQVAKAFLENGKNCLLEKPITSNLQQGQELVSIARENKLIFQIGHLERFNPAILAVEDKIHHPLFIESNRIAPFVERGTDVDVVLDLMIHDIDIILSLVNSKVIKIDAAGIPLITSNIDIANARLKFSSGCVANITSSRVSMKRERKIRIFQKETYFSIDFANLKVHSCYLRPKERNEEGCFQKEVILEEIPCEKGEPLRFQLISFLDSVRHRKKPRVSGQDGLEALKIAQRIKNVIAINIPKRD